MEIIFLAFFMGTIFVVQSYKGICSKWMFGTSYLLWLVVLYIWITTIIWESFFNLTIISILNILGTIWFKKNKQGRKKKIVAKDNIIYQKEFEKKRGKK
jgi:hypothetical protein